MEQYNHARKVYGDRLATILEEDVPNHEPPSPTVDANLSAVVPAPTPTAALTAEDRPAVPAPVASSSAPASDLADAEREKLRREVATWDLRVGQQEVEHIITHMGVPEHCCGRHGFNRVVRR